jgi:hypothetical protein
MDSRSCPLSEWGRINRKAIGNSIFFIEFSASQDSLDSGNKYDWRNLLNADGDGQSKKHGISRVCLNQHHWLTNRMRIWAVPPRGCHLSSLRYDLSKLRAKGLVEKIPHSRRYRLLPQGYSIFLVFLKLSERIYAPLQQACCNPSAAVKNCKNRSALNAIAFLTLSMGG